MTGQLLVSGLGKCIVVGCWSETWRQGIPDVAKRLSEEGQDLVVQRALIRHLGGKMFGVTMPLVVRVDSLHGRRMYFFWFFGYSAKLPWEHETSIPGVTGRWPVAKRRQRYPVSGAQLQVGAGVDRAPQLSAAWTEEAEVALEFLRRRRLAGLKVAQESLGGPRRLAVK